MNEIEAPIRAAIERNRLYQDFTLASIGCTGNNRVCRVTTPQKTFLAKYYFQHPDDPRDRFASEHAFYNFIWGSGIRRTPEPLQWLPQDHLALFEFIDGKKPQAFRPEFLREALDFFHEINRHRHAACAATLPDASESCFSVAEHLNRVDFRIGKLEKIQPATDVDAQALDFVRENLAFQWRVFTSELKKQLKQEQMTLALGRNECCLSPSDFGFHNTLFGDDGRLRFIDFEYAGWDDPAKTVCDFFCQPAVPVGRKHLDDFCAEISAGLSLPGLPERVALLLPVYQIKWCCIMLNEFLPADSRRRAFSNPQDNALERKRNQLAKAIHSLQEVQV